MTAALADESFRLQRGDAVGSGGGRDAQFAGDGRQGDVLMTRPQEFKDPSLRGREALRGPLVPRAGLSELREAPQGTGESLGEGC